MKIIKLVSEGFKRLQAVSIEPKSNVVKITGKNKQGKTSILDSIWAALGGDKAAPQKPIKDGEKKARIELDLGEFKVTRIFTSSGSRLEITNNNGFEAKKPQKILNDLLGKFTFDPLNFMRLSDKDQYDQLMSMIDIKFDSDKLISIVKSANDSDLTSLVSQNIDVSYKNANPLEKIQIFRDSVYSWRTELNKSIKRLVGAIESIVYPEEQQIHKRVSVEDLMNRREKMVQVLNDNNDTRNQLNNACDDLRDIDNDIFDLNNEEKKILEKLTLIRELRDKKYKLKTVLEGTIKEHQAEVDSLIDPDLSSIDDKIKNADKINRLVDMIEEKHTLTDEKNLIEAKTKVLSDVLKKIDAYKSTLLDNTKFPVDGLSVEDGILIYNGSPLSQASDAEQLLVSIKIAMALNPKIRVIRVRDGSLLDSDSFKIIEQIAEENDFQIWVEVVADGPGNGIYIVDGQVQE